jgi:hypothetical protein
LWRGGRSDGIKVEMLLEVEAEGKEVVEMEEVLYWVGT